MRIAATIAASLAALLSLGLLAAGGVLLWGDSKKDDQGYLTTHTERFSTDTYALATGNLDLDLDGLDTVLDQDTYGKIRLKVDSAADTPVFVGIARTPDVTRYLRGTSHALVSDVSYPDFEADYDPQPGAKRPAAPATKGIWAASTRGSGPQTLTWDVEDGNWSIVVMNADASGGVDARISAGAEAPLLAPLGWGMTIAGLLVLAFAAGATVVAVRVPRRNAVAA
ncbi:MAG TPA: hypothetical protein VFX51_28090 [Solirubrobacteraceae bacterium]|nr:hypothetical protein [Solirubrobacteraceae bacterium]